MTELQQNTRRLSRADKIAKVNAWNDECIHSVVGVEMPDGSIFAGMLANGEKLYVMPKNEKVAMSFNEAAERVDKVNAKEKLGHTDWRLPTKEELALLWQNRDKGALKGTFEDVADVYDYWSSTPTPHSTTSFPVVFVQDLVDGSTSRHDTHLKGVVRLVR